MSVILQCFLTIPTNIFYRKNHTKNSYKTHINCNNNNKKNKKYDIPKEDNKLVQLH